jgi:hypothetical protein
MFRTLVSICLACIPLFGANAKTSITPSLTIVLDIRDQHYSTNSLAAMKVETQRILGNIGTSIDWRIKSELPDHAEFSNVVVFTMTGACSMDESPFLIDERGPLALTYVSDGAVLPFGEVRCDRVRASLQRRSPIVTPGRANAMFGVALGRVVAHELYHMLSEEKRHTDAGVSRMSLRADDLVKGSLNLDPVAVSRIGARLHGRN